MKRTSLTNVLKNACLHVVKLWEQIVRSAECSAKELIFLLQIYSKSPQVVHVNIFQAASNRLLSLSLSYADVFTKMIELRQLNKKTSLPLLWDYLQT